MLTDRGEVKSKHPLVKASTVVGQSVHPQWFLKVSRVTAAATDCLVSDRVGSCTSAADTLTFQVYTLTYAADALTRTL